MAIAAIEALRAFITDMLTYDDSKMNEHELKDEYVKKHKTADDEYLGLNTFGGGSATTTATTTATTATTTTIQPITYNKSQKKNRYNKKRYNKQQTIKMRR